MKVAHNDQHDTPQKRMCTNVSFALYISMEKLEKEF